MPLDFTMTDLNTLSKIVRRINSELVKFYPETETKAIISIVLQHIMGFSKLELHTRQNEILLPEQIQRVEKALGLLKKHIPVQYVIGETEFFDILINVSPAVLIPRAETEELVKLALDISLPNNAKILDIGTGSGCIAIALAKNLHKADVFALDVSFEALEIARRNAENVGVKVNFFQRDILKDTKLGMGRYDMIISNPPYVTNNEKHLMEKNVLENEPHLALFVPDSEPLLFYKAISNIAKENLNYNGWLLVEINENYGKETAEIFKERGYRNVEIVKDINGKDRIVKTQYTPS
ncbi:MAG: peptide chain release factor N(5)-glutamine methyltransferase [Bacteroidales bacterium]|nr:peptide chain release factor N(5)-glutamine methyltransferase [Bacteroidales bacterium]